MTFRFLFISCALVSLTTTSAHAETPDPGTMALAGSGSITSSALSGREGATARSWSLTALPSVDRFIGGGVTLGVAAQYVHQRSSNGGVNGFRSTYLLPGAQVGFYLPIGEHAAFWPVLRGSYGVSWTNSDTTESSSRVFEASLTPQFLLLPTKGFFLRFAPGAVVYRATEVRSTPEGGAIGFIGGVSPVFNVGVGVML